MIDQFFSQEEYTTQFHERLTDERAKAFSKKSVDFHLRFYSFSENPVLVSKNEEGEVAAVLFCSFTRDGYVSIINLLTNPSVRRSGHAKKLMSAAVSFGWKIGKRRLRMNCEDNQPTIGFYNSLGFVYLGVTRSGCLYCNVPLTSGVLAEQQWVGKSAKYILGSDPRIRKLVKRRVDWEASRNYKSPDYLPRERYLNTEAAKLCVG